MAVAQATRKREKVRSIKSRLSPEKEAPSFLNRKAMMIIDGGFRLRQRNFSGLRQMCAAESTSVLPVEELLKHGTPLALLACIEGTLFATDGLSNLVLVAHSFGISVAHQLSTHLERQGVRVFGIVALDLRHLSSSVPGIVPRSLADFAMARSQFHLTVSTLDLSTPLVPRGRLSARYFALAAERSATASWLPAATSHHAAALNDMDHFDVDNTGAWDIATKLHRLPPLSAKSSKRLPSKRIA